MVTMHVAKPTGMEILRIINVNEQFTYIQRKLPSCLVTLVSLAVYVFWPPPLISLPQRTL